MTEYPPLPVVDDLTGPERQLLDAARHGRSFAADAPVRALVLRELLLGLRGPVDPRGVRVERTRITGELDLDDVEAVAGLGLVDCVLAEPMSAQHARLPWLDLSGSELTGGSGCALDAEGLRVDDLRLTGTRMSGSGEYGALCLLDARVSGRTRLSGAEFTGADGPALYLDGLRSGALKAVGLRATGAGELGAVRLLGARVDGQADFGHAVLTNESGPALNADGLVVGDSLLLTEATVTGELRLLAARLGEADLTGSTLRGGSGTELEADRLHAGELRLGEVTATGSGAATISLTGARVDGQFTFDGAVLVNDGGRALSADGIRVGDTLSGEGSRVSGSGEYGALCLIGAQVGGHVDLERAELANDTGAALSADRLRVDGSLRLDGVTATGSGEVGTLRLLGARIGGQATIEDARLTSGTGPALYADGLRVEGNLYLAGTHATGAGDRGAIRAHAAGIGGQLLAEGVVCTNESGPALSADDLRVGTYLDFTAMTATASSEVAAVSLSAAQVEGKVTFDGAELTNDTGPALLADRCRVRGSLACTGLRATGGGDPAAVGLVGAHVGGQLTFTGAEIGHGDGGTLVSFADVVVEGPVFFPVEVVGSDGLVFLDGFRFGSLEDVTWREWLELIGSRTAGYRPGPYQRLAAAERAHGHDGQARAVLIAQQRDLRRGRPKPSAGGRRGGSTACGDSSPATATGRGGRPPRCCSPWSPPGDWGSGPGTWPTGPIEPPSAWRPSRRRRARRARRWSSSASGWTAGCRCPRGCAGGATSTPESVPLRCSRWRSGWSRPRSGRWRRSRSSATPGWSASRPVPSAAGRGPAAARSPRPGPPSPSTGWRPR
ncbi:hypothetical protein [Amycolatopsis sp. CA-126428]|uniref:hypothetical protein n=1 Tax=Amycolatopsis sp. CA-126428 TaxID=2073158 RepID=UPI000CD2D4AB|nr:hypothetical protein [Amycolatopsis sp. CA-126428]